jgi:hypothetical protein
MVEDMDCVGDCDIRCLRLIVESLGDCEHQIMIRRGKLTRVEAAILWVFASLLVVTGGAGFLLSASHGHWRVALASLGILGIAATYGLAARRRRSL